MKIERATLDTCSQATGVVVVIDVLRAFTTAPYAFGANARDIVPVESVTEALQLREQFAGSYVMGEVDGFPPDEFDFGNSPSVMMQQDLGGQRLIQRTSSGTQGLVRSENADTLLAASFVCAGATDRYIHSLQPQNVTLVCTGRSDEDQAFADYLEARLNGENPDPAPYLERVNAVSRQRIELFSGKGLVTEAQIEEFRADVACAVDLDRFDFVLLVKRQDGLLVMNAV